MFHDQLDRLCVNGSVSFDALVYFACEVRRLFLVIVSLSCLWHSVTYQE